jgi:hypothetical protein
MRVSGLPLLLASFAVHVPWSYALGQIPTVTTTKPSNGTLLQIAGKGLGAQILVSQEEWWGVLRAAEDLAGDLGKVTGENLTLAYWDGSAASNVSKSHTTVPPPPRGSSNGNGNGGVVGDAAVPGGDLGHNATKTAAGGGITALYTYRAPTSDINVSQPIGSSSFDQQVHCCKFLERQQPMVLVTGQAKADRDIVYTWISTKLHRTDTATV